MDHGDLARVLLPLLVVSVAAVTGAATADEVTKPRDEANHPPIAMCNGDTRRRVVEVKAKPGGEARLSATGSRDPDGDALSYRWWVYDEASHYPRATVELRGADRAEATLVVPRDTLHLHVILEITDDGEPPLTSYRRVVIRCK